MKLMERSVSQPFPKAVVALAGARDRFQVPLALHEVGLLQSLVTDMYWPADRDWFRRSFGSILSESAIRARYCRGLDSHRVAIDPVAFGAATVMYAASNVNLNRYKDRFLGKKARDIALRYNSPLISYNYYATEAFKDAQSGPQYRFLFQLQADPRTLRNIYLEELERTPAARASIVKEKEISLPEHEFLALCAEPHLANGWIATSTYAAQTLVEQGIPADKIHVIPYGVDSQVFAKRPSPPNDQQLFKVVYVGTWIQRKGASYLLDAMRLLQTRKIRLTICTRGFVDRELLKHYSDLDIDIKVGLSGKQLAHELHSGDVFVLPSLAEGFGHVILETMSCGIPVITTSHTCGPDVMTDGVHGFLVPIRDAKAIAEKLTWGIEHRAELAAMGEAAASQARLFTWERFRARIREAYPKLVAAVD